MKCNVCGAESGKYPLCWNCNKRKEKGEVIKCTVCKQWHLAGASCPPAQEETNTDNYLYEPRASLITQCEASFYAAICASLPEGFFAFPQVNLAAFILRTDQSSFHNELFRNVDFLITDNAYIPKIAVEINDQSHLERNRKTRDQKVCKILEEAGIPLLTLWTSYGINQPYIKSRITELLQAPVNRVHHFTRNNPDLSKSAPQATEQSIPSPEAAAPTQSKPDQSKSKKPGCYIATCVYESYDCPQVWRLRRFRDQSLRPSLLGRLFIRIYYAVSPALVLRFGQSQRFRACWKWALDHLLRHLQRKGVPDTPYQDPND